MFAGAALTGSATVGVDYAGYRIMQNFRQAANICPVFVRLTMLKGGVLAVVPMLIAGRIGTHVDRQMDAMSQANKVVVKK